MTWKDYSYLTGPILAYFHFFKERKYIYKFIMLFSCLCFQRLNLFTDFHEIWYEFYDIGGYPNNAF
jgi:hypothetical protein